MEREPKTKQIAAAFNRLRRAVEETGVGGAYLELSARLSALRDAKFTWDGVHENRLRREVDKFLGRL